MFSGWGEYYLLIGSGAAALIGLLFIVATLTSNMDRSTVRVGASLYTSPIVFHLAVVLVLSAMALAPGVGRTAAGLACGAASLAGLIAAVKIVLGIRSRLDARPHWSDLWCYGVGPGLVYLALAFVSASILMNRPGAETGVAVAALALLLVAIRNAWDLVTWLVPRP
jgi:hypothetical protein